MDKISLGQELPIDPFELTQLNKDDVIISGPKNGLLWRGEEANPTDLKESLKKVFETGFTLGNEQSPLAELPYIKSHSNFICAFNTYYIVKNNGKKILLAKNMSKLLLDCTDIFI
ncbi:MAG: hypothetical protein RLY40_938 [Pseudomonadota bacterium]|jgi:hypothetical protein